MISDSCSVGVGNLKLPLNSSVLLYGPPGRDKLLFSLSFVYEGLKNGESGIIVLTDRDPEEQRELFKSINKDISFYEKKNKLIFVDVYSWAEGENVQESKFMVAGPGALNQLVMTLTRAVEKARSPKKGIRIVFDNVSTLLTYSSPEIITRFLQIIGARLENHGTSLFILEKGMHDDKIVTMIQHMTDATVEFEKGKLKISRSAFDTNWLKYSVGSSGLKMSK